MTKATADLSVGNEMRITRIFDAPPELVWAALTDPAHVDAWWGPDGFTNITEKNDFRPGGSWVFIMRGPDGTEFPNAITYREIDPPKKFSYHQGTSTVVDPDNDFTTVITLEDLGGKTRVVLLMTLKDQAKRDQLIRDYGALEGGKQHLDNLATYIDSLSS